MATRMPLSVREAKEQAAEYFGFTASVFIQVEGGETFEIPNPGLMNDDQQERFDKLQFDLEKCDREESITLPSYTLEDGQVIPERIIPGDFITPYRINGELISPPYSVRLATVLFGEPGYKKYKAGGGVSSQVVLEWGRMNKEFQERVDADPKSLGSDSPVEAVQ